MPVGVVINCLSVVVGGLVGTVAGKKLSAGYKEKMNMVFGACAMTMGISSIVLMEICLSLSCRSFWEPLSDASCT